MHAAQNERLPLRTVVQVCALIISHSAYTSYKSKLYVGYNIRFRPHIHKHATHFQIIPFEVFSDLS
jgi:hypothetical protein